MVRPRPFYSLQRSRINAALQPAASDGLRSAHRRDKNFRQLHSKTPGHPEIGYTPGVETTTGPLGQGLANAVGLAIAERTLAAQFNQPEHEIVDHFTYVFMGDGCLMEGISHEVCSLAGTLGLGKLIGFYDHNGISIDGETKGWFTDDTAKRFEAYHWHVVHEIDGHDPEAVKKAILEAQSVKDKPSLIICRTVIGFGSPNKAGKEEAHGAALGNRKWRWRVRNSAGITRRLRSRKRFTGPGMRVKKGKRRRKAGRRSLLRISRPIRSWRRSLRGA